MSKEEALRRLQGVKHIVVLMMENRSFDQMLGFLEKDGLEVEGIAKAEKVAAEHPNLNPGDPKPFAPFEWGPGETAPEPPPGLKPKVLDPCHSPDCVREQLEDQNTGFVRNFAATRKDADGKELDLAREFLEVPMGHFGPDHLPVYRHLAHNFCVC